MNYRLPNCERAIIPQEKIVEYLLNIVHPEGKSKAKFFIAIGFDKVSLINALQLSVCDGIVNSIKITSFGTKYMMDQPISAPNDRVYEMETVWIIESGTELPRLVTAYPN